MPTPAHPPANGSPRPVAPQPIQPHHHAAVSAAAAMALGRSVRVRDMVPEDTQPKPTPSSAAVSLRVTVDDRAYLVTVEPAEVGGALLPPALPGSPPVPPLPPERAAAAPDFHAPWHNLAMGQPGEIVAPAPGRVVAVLVSVDQPVKPGDAIVAIEFAPAIDPGAKATQGTLRTLFGGVIRQIAVQPGQALAAGDAIARVGL